VAPDNQKSEQINKGEKISSEGVSKFKKIAKADD